MGIGIRDVVVFVSKHKDKSRFIVRELRIEGKALIESLSNNEYYLVPIDDIKTSH